jgi:hypothetical protein
VNVGIIAGSKDLGGNGVAVSDGIGVSDGAGVKVFVEDEIGVTLILLGVGVNEFTASD